jgi:hypothetical protein
MSDEASNFEAVAASVYRMADQPSGEERRKYRRTPVAGQVTASIVRSDAPPILAYVLDLSRGGMGLSCTDAIKRGQQFVVTVNLGSGPLRFTCKSANCRRGQDTRFIIGAEFVEIQRHTAGPSDNTSGPSHESEALDADGSRHVAEVAKRLEKALGEL